MAPKDSNLGTQVGNCKIRKKIGEGAQSVVYLGRHEALQKNVALKILDRSVLTDQQQVDRFLAEARSAARLEHPNIVQVFDAGSSEDRHYMTMQYVNGPTLDRKVSRRRPLKPVATARIFRQLADALRMAHKEGIVHRDIKPGNIIFTRDDLPKLCDFGLARDAQRNLDLTEKGTPVGTPRFMSPEQVEGKAATARSDLFSLGGTMYMALTGRPPFECTSLVKLMNMILKEPPPEEPLKKARVPEPLRAIVRKLLEKDPKDRYASADQLIRELDAFLAGRTGKRLALREETATRLGLPVPSRLVLWFFPILAGLFWFAFGLAPHGTAAGTGWIHTLTAPFLPGAPNLWIRIGLFVFAAACTFLTHFSRRDRFDAASQIVLAATWIFLYGTAALSDPLSADEGFFANLVSTVSSIASAFPGPALGILFAAVVCVSAPVLRIVFGDLSRAKWISLALCAFAATAGFTLCDPPTLESVPVPVMIGLAVALGLVAAGHLTIWTTEHRVIRITVGTVMLFLGFFFAISTGAADFSGDGFEWLRSVEASWGEFPIRLREEGALWIAAAGSAVWAHLLPLR